MSISTDVTDSLLFNVVLCINLKRRPDRKEQIINECRRVKLASILSFVEAIDGSLLDDHLISSKLINVPHKGIKLWKTQYACALSHIKAMEEFVSLNVSAALILEDDALFSSDFVSRYNEVNTTASLINKSNYWSILTLGHLFDVRTVENTHSTSLSTLDWFCGAHAYIIKRIAAIRFIN